MNQQYSSRRIPICRMHLKKKKWKSKEERMKRKGKTKRRKGKKAEIDPALRELESGEQGSRARF